MLLASERVIHTLYLWGIPGKLPHHGREKSRLMPQPAAALIIAFDFMKHDRTTSPLYSQYSVALTIASGLPNTKIFRYRSVY